MKLVSEAGYQDLAFPCGEFKSQSFFNTNLFFVDLVSLGMEKVAQVKKTAILKTIKHE